MQTDQPHGTRPAGGHARNPADDAEHLRLSMILDQMPVGIGVFDSAGALFHSNRHFERAASGAIPSLQTMTGQYWRPAPGDGEPIDEAAYPAMRALNGDIATPGLDFVRQTSDGRNHWVSVSAVPLTGPNSTTVLGVVLVVEEAEAKRRVAEQLRAKEERFRRFAQYSSNALWIADHLSGRIAFLSAAAADIWTGLAENDVIDALDRIIHPDDLAHISESRREVAIGHVQRFSYRIVDAEGEVVRHVRETSFLIPGEPGGSDCIGGIVEDVSPEQQIYLIQSGDRSPALLRQISQRGRRIKTFSSQEELMRIADVLNPGCVIVDLRAWQAEPAAIATLLSQRPADLEMIFVGAAQTPVSQVVDAMRAGASDYLIEPLDEGALENAVMRAFNASSVRIEPVEDAPDPSARFRQLSRREREVLEGLVAGGTNKSIARELGISPRTIEVHRAHLMERLNARSLSELLQMVHQAGAITSNRKAPGS